MVNSATVLLCPLEEQESPSMNVIGIGVNDHSTVSLVDTTDAGQYKGTASHEQLPSDDIVEGGGHYIEWAGIII